MLSKIVLVGVFAVILLSGCAFNQPTGARFSPEILSSTDKALVYFYRPPGESFGYDRTYFLGVNGQKVVNLLHGGYFPYKTGSGNLSLVSDVNRSLRTNIAGGFAELAANPQVARLDVSVEAGKTYYVRMRPEAHAFHFTPHLMLVPKEVGEREIADCKLLTSETGSK